MSTHCFTSFSFHYLSRASVLAESLKRHHPQWILWAVITDCEPPGYRFDAAQAGFDRVLWAFDLYGDQSIPWIFMHDVVEACTAVKGRALQIIFEAGATQVVYLDPDIAVFSSLSDLEKMHDRYSILLTPHQIVPEEVERAVIDNEITSLRLGTYNLGFISIKNDRIGNDFVQWWVNRLYRYCYDAPSEGIFVDQKWCDLVPALFDGVKIIREPGYNVASWNLSSRRAIFTSRGEIEINGDQLKFFHFTKLGPLGDMMTQRYAADNTEIYELWNWYRRQIRRHSVEAIPDGWWHFATFEDGSKIPKAARVLYRDRKDLQLAFKNPFKVGGGSYFEWLNAHGTLSQSAR